MTKNIKTLNLLIKNAAHPSRRDNSLLMRRIRRNKDFDLANSGISGDLLTDILYTCKSGSFSLINDNLDTDDQNNQAYKIKSIRKKSNLIREETGLSPLAVGFPFFEGWLSDWYRGPLVLIPVEIRLTNSSTLNNWSFIINKNAEVSINLALLITLQQELGMKFDPEAVPNWEVKDIMEQPEKFWQEIQSYFPDNLINNWDILNNSIRELPEVSGEDTPAKDDYSATLELKPYAVLGHFPQGKNSLVNDLIKIKSLIKEDKLSSLAEHILGNYEGNTFSEVIDEEVENVDNYSEEEILKVLPADVTQEEVLLQSKKSKSLVVQGPPGTGKSQTIVNLIGDSLNQDEKVLLVCEKRVALEVVYNMLEELGLDFLAVIVGGSGSSRKASEKHVYNTLRQIAQAAKNSKQVDLDKYNQNIDQSIKELNRVHSLLNQSLVDDDPGLTLERLYKTFKAVSIDNLTKFSSFSEVQTAKELENRKEKIINFLKLKNKVAADSVWKNRKPGVLTESNLTDQDLIEKRKILIRSQITAPLNKSLSENNYSEIMNLENDYKAVNNYNLQLLSEMKNNSFRFFSPEWLKIRLNMFRAVHKIKKEQSKIKDEMESLKSYFDDDYINEQLLRLKKGEGIQDFADDLYQDWKNDKHIILRIDKIYSEADQNFADDLLELGKLNQSPEAAAELYERTVKTNWVQKMHNQHPELNYFLNNKYEDLKEKLNSNLELKLKKGKLHLINKYKKRQKDKLNTDRGQKIIKISGRQRKLPSLRKLLDDFEDIILDILPVWLASPDQVARLFKLETEFDHVIFDEASQIPLENALSGLVRGKRITVVGDKNQMPPTRLFYRTISNEESDNLSEDENTSLLDAADDVWPDKMLKYHYRSKYPELIEFSNKAFYEGQLMIAPVNEANDYGAAAVNWHQIDGRWDNQTNIIEAESVINFLLENLPEEKENLDTTLWGIVTFNQKQADLLIDLLQKKLEEERSTNELSDVEKEIWEWCLGGKSTTKYLWIKNLENVQGDEVQNLIISVAYGIDEKMGRVANRFGLLNQEGGDKRLNVAITRAQEKIDVFCSFDPDTDLEVSGTSGRGPKLFKQYLRFVKYISAGKTETAVNILDNIRDENNFADQEFTLHDYDSPFEKEVAQALRNRGYEVHTQIGSYGYSIDLGIVNPKNTDEYLLGIECDGATYHRTKSAKERDINRQRFLENKGWEIARIWSRKWWEKPEEVIDEMENKIKTIIENKENDQQEPEKNGDDSFYVSEESNSSKVDRVDNLMEKVNYHDRFKELTRRILKLMRKKKKGFRSTELQDELNYRDSNAIRKALKPLIKQGVIFKRGKGSGTKYHLRKDYH